MVQKPDGFGEELHFYTCVNDVAITVQCRLFADKRKIYCAAYHNSQNKREKKKKDKLCAKVIGFVEISNPPYDKK